MWENLRHAFTTCRLFQVSAVVIVLGVVVTGTSMFGGQGNPLPASPQQQLNSLVQNAAQQAGLPAPNVPIIPGAPLVSPPGGLQGAQQAANNVVNAVNQGAVVTGNVFNTAQNAVTAGQAAANQLLNKPPPPAAPQTMPPANNGQQQAGQSNRGSGL